MVGKLYFLFTITSDISLSKIKPTAIIYRRELPCGLPRPYGSLGTKMLEDIHTIWSVPFPGLFFYHLVSFITVPILRQLSFLHQIKSQWICLTNFLFSLKFVHTFISNSLYLFKATRLGSMSCFRVTVGHKPRARIWLCVQNARAAGRSCRRGRRWWR